MAARTITLRLQTKDADKVLNALRSTGAEGRKMAQTLERSGASGSRGLRAIDRAAGGLRDRFNSFASRIPIIGQSLAALGPAGVAAAAGLAAVTLGLARGLRVAREATRAFDDIAKRADTFNVLTDTLQALRLAAIEEDVGVETMERGLTRLAVGASQAAIGTGTLVTSLERSHPELVEAIGNAETMEERLRLVTDALQSARNETEFNNIAYAAFGRAGLDMARMLSRAADGIDGLIARAREAGVVIDEHILRNAEEMENRLGVAAEVTRLQLQQAFVDLAPVLVGTAELFADIAGGLSNIIDRTRELEMQSTARLESRAAALREEMAAAAREEVAVEERRNLTIAERLRLLMAIGQTMRTVRDVGLAHRQSESAPDRQLERIEAELDRRRAARVPGGSSGGPAGDSGGDTDVASAVREAEARARSAIAIRRQLGDISGVLAQREAELAELVAHGNLTRAEANQALRQYRDALVASTESGRMAAGVIAATQTPLEQYQARLFELDRLLAQNTISEDVHMRAVILATDAYEAADPALSRAAAIREQLMTTEQLLAREQQSVNELVAAGALEYQEGADWIEAYRDQLDQTASAVSELRFEEELLDRVLKGQVETWQDLGRVALQVLADIVRSQIAATDTAQGFGSYLTQIIGGAIGGAFGGSASTASASAGFGARGGAAAAAASVSRTASAGSAPVISAPIIVAPGAAADRGLRVVVNNNSDAKVEARERHSPTGERELEIFIHRIVAGGFATGQFDGPMQNRFRVRAAPNGRG